MTHVSCTAIHQRNHHSPSLVYPNNLFGTREFHSASLMISINLTFIARPPTELEERPSCADCHDISQKSLRNNLKWREPCATLLVPKKNFNEKKRFSHLIFALHRGRRKLTSIFISHAHWRNVEFREGFFCNHLQLLLDSQVPSLTSCLEIKMRFGNCFLWKFLPDRDENSRSIR